MDSYTDVSTQCCGRGRMSCVHRLEMDAVLIQVRIIRT